MKTLPFGELKGLHGSMGRTQLRKFMEAVAGRPAPSLAGFQAARGAERAIPLNKVSFFIIFFLSWKMLPILDFPWGPGKSWGALSQLRCP